MRKGAWPEVGRCRQVQAAMVASHSMDKDHLQDSMVVSRDMVNPNNLNMDNRHREDTNSKVNMGNKVLELSTANKVVLLLQVDNTVSKVHLVRDINSHRRTTAAALQGIRQTALNGPTERGDVGSFENCYARFMLKSWKSPCWLWSRNWLVELQEEEPQRITIFATHLG